MPGVLHASVFEVSGVSVDDLAHARDSGGANQLQNRAGAYGVYDGLIY